MSLMDILQQYKNAGGGDARDYNSAHDDFDHVTGAAPSEVLGQGVGDAFRSERTPPFGDMVSQMYAKSDSQQKAGVLNHLLRSLGPGVLSSLGGGLLGRIASANAGRPGVQSQVDPDTAEKVTPEQVKEIAQRAEQHDPSIMDKVGGFYAEHPQLVKTLGSAVLAVALAGMSNRMRGR
jgi:hypothetical protein